MTHPVLVLCPNKCSLEYICPAPRRHVGACSSWLAVNMVVGVFLAVCLSAYCSLFQPSVGRGKNGRNLFMWNLCELAVLWQALFRGMFFKLGAVQFRNVTTFDGGMVKAVLSLYTLRASPSVRECNTVYHWGTSCMCFLMMTSFKPWEYNKSFKKSSWLLFDEIVSDYTCSWLCVGAASSTGLFLGPVLVGVMI